MKKTFCLLTVSLAFALAGQAAELGRSVPETVYSPSSGGADGRLSGNPATGLQLALVDPAQIFNAEYDVYGLRLNLLYGRNQNLRGLDFGIVNHLNGMLEGVQIGAGNLAGSMAGVQLGLYNSAGVSEDGGFQMGLFNQATSFTGFQLAAVNFSGYVHGLQMGLINLCETIDGVQIGIINIISQSDFLVFCPIVNGQF